MVKLLAMTSIRARIYRFFFFGFVQVENRRDQTKTRREIEGETYGSSL